MDQYFDEDKILASLGSGSEDSNGIELFKHPESDPVVASIKKMLQTKSPSSSQCNIYKVPKSLRSLNPKAYTPQVISIGPLHYGKRDLMVMEEHKLSYLQSFFGRINLDPEAAVEKVRMWEERARNCYAENIKMSIDKFVKLIIVDGCFVVEYFIRYCFPQFQDEIDHLLHGRLSSDLLYDLIKLENQLPFFVLEGLFQFYSSFGSLRHVSFFELSCTVFGHLYKNKEKVSDVFDHKTDHFVKHLWVYFIPHSPSPVNLSHDPGAAHIYLCPPTATELYEAGVLFKKAENKCIGDVITGTTFKNGVLEIPHIEIYDDFETYLRNLIAFEQCHRVDRYVTQFALLMDGLIDTDKDVSLLIKGGIITNYLGSNEDVFKLFNNLCKHIDIGDAYYFNNLYREIYEYCGTRRHRWMASLRRDYFNTPWASISFTAAVFLLILTLIQTILSAISIKK